MGVCHSSKNQFNEKGYNTIKDPDKCSDFKENTQSSNPKTTTFNDDGDDFSIGNISISTKSTISDSSQQSNSNALFRDEYKPKLSAVQETSDQHENKFNPHSWTQLLSVPEQITIHQPLILNKNEILILPDTIKSDVDLVKIPTYLYSYNVTKNKYEKFSQYPHEFPNGTHITTYDPKKQKLYVFTEKGYISCYDMNRKNWNWDIIHGVTIYDSHNLRNGCSCLIDNKLNIISGQQHLEWNKNNKQLKLLESFEVWNYGSLVYKEQEGTLLLIGGNDPSNVLRGNATTLDTLYSYSLQNNHWVKLKRKLPFGVHNFGCVMTRDERYVVIFGGTQLPEGCVYDGILVMDLRTFKVRKSKIKCPMEGDVYACLMIDELRMDLILNGMIRKCFGDNLKDDGKRMNDECFVTKDVIDVMKMYYCIENVHLFDRKGVGHWRMQIDHILQ